MRVVIGWVASCHKLSLDRLDDIYLAVETLLAEESVEGGEFILDLAAEAEYLRVFLDGLENGQLKDALLATDGFEPCDKCPLDVGLLLRALVERFEVVEREGGIFGVRLHTQIS